MEFENVKEALESMYAHVESSQVGGTMVRTNNEKPHEETVKELADAMFEYLANICDLLGMSEVYLED